jgi:hypothetical protein
MLPPLVVGFVERNRGVFGHELRLVDRNAITLKRVVVCSRKNKLAHPQNLWVDLGSGRSPS